MNGGRFANLLGQLRTAGMIDYDGKGGTFLTPAGRLAAPAIEPGSARDRLGRIIEPSHAKVLDALPKDGSPVSREDLAAAAGYEAGGGRFANLLGKLSTLGAITYPQKGLVAVETWVWA
jgi:hypothetical protein